MAASPRHPSPCTAQLVAMAADMVVEVHHGGTLSSLPAELLFELAVRSPIRALCRVVRVDARLVACVRLQRWFRRWEGPRDALLRVGDRVLVRGEASAWHRGALQYATAAAQVQGRASWKVQLLNDEYVNVPSCRIRRLRAWANGPFTGSVGFSAAVVCASRARGAAAHATTAAVLAVRAGVSNAQTALAIAAATAASTAAAAATAASSAVAPPAAKDVQHAQEAGELLLAAKRMQEAVLTTQSGARALSPLASPPCPGNATPMLAQAATAAKEAAAEAGAAASAAEAAAAVSAAAGAVGAISVTASTAATAALAAEQVATAVAAMAVAPSSTATSRAAETAADAIAEVGVAGLALSSVLASGGDGEAAAKVLLQAAVTTVASNGKAPDEPLHVPPPSLNCTPCASPVGYPATMRLPCPGP